MSSSMSLYFQPVVGVDPSQLLMTNVSLYSTTPFREANFISRTILNFYSKGSQFHSSSNEQGEKTTTICKSELKPLTGSLPTITDACSHVGGNTISFYLSGFKTINAVEIDEKTCDMLKHNLSAYCLPTDNVHCCDYMSIYLKLVQDVVFLDPEWGGPDYKKSPCLDLFLGQINIIEICCKLFNEKKVSLIVIKVPTNYNLSALVNNLPNKTFLTHKILRGTHHSYNVVFCW
jgi:hypothetical protein